MADFHQKGPITSLHALYEAFNRDEYLTTLETKIEEHARNRRITLLLPSLFSEIENPQVLDRILDAIEKVGYLHNVAIALGVAPEEDQFRRARQYFGRLADSERNVRVVWVDGPRIRQILSDIQERELPIGVTGKGQSVWITLGRA